VKRREFITALDLPGLTWDTTDGNVILSGDETAIDFFLTSRSVRNFELRKSDFSLAG
jgi:hypothetical protein